MRKNRRAHLGVLAVAIAMVAFPASSQAANSNSVVTGTVGTELSLGVSTPAAMTFSHAAPSSTSALVSVVSTQPSWTLSVSDNNTGANAGKMLKTAGAGSAATGSPLENALEWSADNSTFTSLTGTAAQVTTGSLVSAKTVYWRQALGATENVSADDVYALTAKYTVN